GVPASGALRARRRRSGAPRDAGVSPFPEDTVALLDTTREVDIETRSTKGTQHSVTIWVVVVDGAPYVRSYLGKRGRWYRELMARREGALVARGKRVRVRPAQV